MAAVTGPADVCPPSRPGRARAIGTSADCGATMVEYALLVAAIAMVVLGAAILFGDAVLGLFQRALTALP
jgi:Flp pilus assembly pilin Flp